MQRVFSNFGYFPDLFHELVYFMNNYDIKKQIPNFFRNALTNIKKKFNS